MEVKMILNRHPSSSDIRGIYHDIRLFSAEIATTDMARDGLVGHNRDR